MNQTRSMPDRLSLSLIVAGSLLANTLASGFTNPPYLDAVYWYLPMAEALARGDLSSGLDIAVPPLHPALIALFYFLGIPLELAGRLVSIVLGALITLPLYLLGRRLGGSRVGLYLAGLGVLHPTMIKYAADVRPEIPLAFFLVWALERGVAWVEKPDAARAATFGLLVGLAYLVKPEGFGLLPVVLLYSLFLALLTGNNRKRRAARTLLTGSVAVVVFFSIAQINMLNVYVRTGSWMLTNKAGLALTNKLGKDQPLPQSLTEDHTEVRLFAQIYQGKGIQETSLSELIFGEPVYHTLRIAENFVKSLRLCAGTLAYYPLALWILAFLPGRRRRACWRLELLPVWVVVSFLGAYSLLWVRRRMMVPILPLALVWSAIGLASAVNEDGSLVWGQYEDECPDRVTPPPSALFGSESSDRFQASSARCSFLSRLGGDCKNGPLLGEFTPGRF